MGLSLLVFFLFFLSFWVHTPIHVPNPIYAPRLHNTMCFSKCDFATNPWTGPPCRPHCLANIRKASSSHSKWNHMALFGHDLLMLFIACAFLTQDPCQRTRIHMMGTGPGMEISVYIQCTRISLSLALYIYMII